MPETKTTEQKETQTIMIVAQIPNVDNQRAFAIKTELDQIIGRKHGGRFDFRITNNMIPSSGGG